MLNYNDRMNSYFDIPLRYIAASMRDGVGRKLREEREREREKKVVIRRISHVSFDPWLRDGDAAYVYVRRK